MALTIILNNNYEQEKVVENLHKYVISNIITNDKYIFTCSDDKSIKILSIENDYKLINTINKMQEELAQFGNSLYLTCKGP